MITYSMLALRDRPSEVHRRCVEAGLGEWVSIDPYGEEHIIVADGAGVPAEKIIRVIGPSIVWADGDGNEVPWTTVEKTLDIPTA